jgi:hypothetical protein
MGSPRDSIHVIPVGDLIDHDVDTDDGCVCGPTTEPVQRLDGTVGWMLVHHSLDGRETSEKGRYL